MPTRVSIRRRLSSGALCPLILSQITDKLRWYRDLEDGPRVMGTLVNIQNPWILSDGTTAHAVLPPSDTRRTWESNFVHFLLN